jgi:hypothetical protein
MTYFIIVLLLFCFGLIAFFLLSTVALGSALLFWGRQNKEAQFSTKNDELEKEPEKIFLAARNGEGLPALEEELN